MPGLLDPYNPVDSWVRHDDEEIRRSDGVKLIRGRLLVERMAERFMCC